MKTKLIAMLAGMVLVGCEGIRQSNNNEPSATYRPLPKSASYTTKPGIDYACQHDGKHGDEATITVEHNGKTATQTIALTELLERRPEEIERTALSTFNATKSADNFERWMNRVYRLAPRFGLTLHPPDEPTEREWFYLYYWQYHVSPKRAIIETLQSDFLNQDGNRKAVNDTLRSWLIHYAISKHGVIDKIGYGREIAPTRETAIAHLKYETADQGTLKVLSVERERPFPK